jgi:glycosyltransferase involved in cell wall biosynthesis
VDISIVIPTYNRSNILRQCLECLGGQKLQTGSFEVVVVNDGSNDSTSSVVAAFSGSPNLNIQYFEQENQGQGVARNLGISKAKAEIILLIGDDILVGDDFIAQHLFIHRLHPEEHVSCLGLIEWHPSLEVTSYMQWLTNGSSVFGRFGGHQFAFEKLEGKLWADYNFFYTSNLSLKRSFLRKFPFDLSFSSYGWEDIELGYRMTREAGLKVRYNHKAVGYHLHSLDEASLQMRMQKIGESAWVFHEKFPELAKVPGNVKRFVFWLFSNRVSLLVLSLFKGRFTALYYYALSKKYFMEGVRIGGKHRSIGQLSDTDGVGKIAKV